MCIHVYKLKFFAIKGFKFVFLKQEINKYIMKIY